MSRKIIVPILVVASIGILFLLFNQNETISNNNCQECWKKNTECFSCCDHICSEKPEDCGPAIDCVIVDQKNCVNEIWADANYSHEEKQYTDLCVCNNYKCKLTK